MSTVHPIATPIIGVGQRLGEALFASVRPVMRILIVADSEIAFAPGAGFGLSQLIDTLSRPPAWMLLSLRAGIDVDLARRGLGNPARTPNPARYEPTFENFRFTMDQFDLDDYDQVWLFGFWSEGHPGTLTPAEVARLMAWMNAGGGVFAL